MSIMTAILDVDHGIAALDEWLPSQDYTRASREGIARHIRTFGTLEGVVPLYLDPEHSEAATDVFLDALPAVNFSAPEWGPAGYITPVDAIPWDATVTLTVDDPDDDSTVGFPEPKTTPVQRGHRLKSPHSKRAGRAPTFARPAPSVLPFTYC